MLIHIYFDILMHNFVQRSFTSAACPACILQLATQGTICLTFLTIRRGK